MRRYLLLTFSSLAILCSTTEAPGQTMCLQPTGLRNDCQWGSCRETVYTTGCRFYNWTPFTCSGTNCGGPTCCGAELFSDCDNGGCGTEWTKQHDSDFRHLAASLGRDPCLSFLPAANL